MRPDKCPRLVFIAAYTFDQECLASVDEPAEARLNDVAQGSTVRRRGRIEVVTSRRKRDGSLIEGGDEVLIDA